MSVLGQLFRTKSLDELVAETHEEGHQLRKALGPWNLVALGIESFLRILLGKDGHDLVLAPRPNFALEMGGRRVARTAAAGIGEAMAAEEKPGAWRRPRKV